MKRLYKMTAGILVFFAMMFGVVAQAISKGSPNIVWIVVDDMSCHFGYQGEKLVKTPHVDRLAREGVVFRKAYVTAPVCSTFRSAVITGMYQTSIGAHHHRSSRGELKNHLPKGMKTIPEMFREAGYYTSNADAAGKRPGKEDYNFVYKRTDLYDGLDWSGREPGQPFFAQFQLRGGKLRNVDAWYEETAAGLNKADLVAAEDVTLPPYYPDHPVIRKDWAEYLNSVQYTDVEVGRIIARLKEENLIDNTIVFFLTDHGISHARGKQFLYEEGLKIPFVVWAPDRLKAAARDELIAHIDLSATSLHFAGIEIPKGMQGRPLFGNAAKPRKFVVSARDRCDETVDHIRSIRMGNYKYIRNYLPNRPYLQPCAYKDDKPFTPVLCELHRAGKLNAAQSLQMAEIRPKEELYDLTEDPWEIENLADSKSKEALIKRFRRMLSAWEKQSKDQGRIPELEANYDSDMAAYLSPRMKKRSPDNYSKVEANVALMKKWKSEGK
ncbi:sulfatase [Verrucomicrobia bacterium]|nr:sulfatase [Verrucomicrobiota bacterium]